MLTVLVPAMVLSSVFIRLPSEETFKLLEVATKCKSCVATQALYVEWHVELETVFGWQKMEMCLLPPSAYLIIFYFLNVLFTDQSANLLEDAEDEDLLFN